ncbi:ABC-F type ribosomal protection protein [Bacillus sp. 1P06AnD]
MKEVRIQALGLAKAFNEKTIINHGDLTISDGERLGLTGYNGQGKTTLLKMLMGLVEPDKGTIRFFPENLVIGYLPQMVDIRDGKKIEDMYSNDYMQQLSKIGNGHDLLEILSSRGSASGGEKVKLALTALLDKKPDILFLDEPTNHLDAKGMEWLLKQLNAFKGAIILISHDRHFLDQLATGILELENGKLTAYTGTYSDYRLQKEKDRESLQRAYDNQQQHIRDIEEQISHLSQWASKAHRQQGKKGFAAESRIKEIDGVRAKKRDKQVQSKRKRLEAELKKEKVEKPEEEWKVDFSFRAEQKHGKRILEAKGLAKSFGERTLFEKSHFYVKGGEKAALLGENGSGKTTFVSMLLGNEDITKGSLWKSPSLKIGYFSQELTDIPLEKTALEFINAGVQTSLARTILANMGITALQLKNKLSAFSQGELMKVKLVSMLLDSYDLLVLDEPTNHLDLPSRETLEKTLSEFTGTLLIISHDRYLIDAVCDKLLVIEGKRIKRIESTLKEHEKRAEQNVERAKLDEDNERAVNELKRIELIGQLSTVQPDSEEYKKLNEEFDQLMHSSNRNDGQSKGCK